MPGDAEPLQKDALGCTIATVPRQCEPPYAQEGVSLT